MVEELLELLVGVVDAQLLERVVLEDLKAGNVEQADETVQVARRGRQRLCVRG